MSRRSVVTGEWAVVGERRNELGEGARWVGDRFVLVDLLAGRLFSTSGDPDAGLTPELALDVPLGAVAPRRDGVGWIAAAGHGVAHLAGGDRQPTWLAQPAADRSVPMRMNDGVADPHGRFWAGAMPYGGETGTGFLLRVDPDGSVHTVLGGLTIPNGPAFTADGRRMYLADTPTGWIRSYAVDPATGALGPAQDVAHVSEGGPDGMTVDAEGCLWSAVWGGSCLLRLAPDGTLLERVPVPAAQPTSIALSPGTPSRILVTTAAHGLEDPGPFDGRVLVADVAVAGRDADAFGPAPA